MNIPASVRRPALVFGLASLAVAASGVLMGVSPSEPPSLDAITVPRVSDFQVQTIELPAAVVPEAGLPAEPPAQADVTVRLGDQDVRLDLAKHSLRSPAFQFIVQEAGGALVNAPPPPVKTYRGSVRGYPGSAVAASIENGELTAHVDLGDGGSGYVVQPASDFPDSGLPAGSHVSFRRADIDRSGMVCGNEFEPAGPGNVPSAAGDGAGDGTGLNTVEIAIDMDYAYFADNGLSAVAALDDMESVMNTVEFIYERDVQITFELTFAVLRTDPGSDPYTGLTTTNAMLSTMTATWNLSPFNFAKRDVVHLFTGSATSDAIGRASLSTICVTSSAYGVAWSTFSTNFDLRYSLHAHEMGHNWSAQHCDSLQDCFIMCSVVNQCDGTTGPNLLFGPNSMASINFFEGSRTCLNAQAETLTPPFFDDFPSTLIDTNKWNWNNFTSTSSASSNPPSAPNTLRMYAFGMFEFRDSELRTNFIDLSDQTNLVVSYQTEHVGVEAGESIVVEFWAADLVWRVLNTIVSDGIDQTNFVSHQHDLNLAADAYHDEFRLRFRTEVSETNDNWYVDDVYVGELQIGACCAGELCLVFSEAFCNAGGGVYLGNGSECGPVNPCAPPPVCPEDLSGNGQVDFADILAAIGAWGPCAACPEDLDSSGDVGFSDILQIIGAWGPC